MVNVLARNKLERLYILIHHNGWETHGARPNRGTNGAHTVNTAAANPHPGSQAAMLHPML